MAEMTEQHEQRDRIAYLDFLRAVAILYIIGIHHIDDYASNFFQSKFDDILTDSMLGLFVFISGYLLTMRYPEMSTGSRIIEYLKKRFLRIYPLYAIALILFCFCSLLPTKLLAEHLLLLDMFRGSSVITLWFTSMICFFYLLFIPLTFKFRIKKTIFISSFLFLTLIILKDAKVDVRLFQYLPVFVLGIISAKCDLPQYFTKNQALTGLMSLLFILFVVGLLYYRSSAPYFIYIHYLFHILVMMAFVFPALFIGDKCSSWAESDIIRKIAYASFCMYLLHRVVFYLLISIYKPSQDVLMIVYLMFIGLPLTYFLSYMLQYQYDRLIFRLERISC